VSSAPASYKAIICVDIERFSDPDRIDPQRVAMRRGLYGALERAFDWAGFPAEQRYHEDRGDGAFFLVPVEEPHNRLIKRLPFELAAGLARHNLTADAMTRIRLRVVLHTGYVRVDSQGAVGTALNEAFRVLNAPESRDALRDSPGDLAFVIPDEFHRKVIRERLDFDPSGHRPVRIREKEADIEAWVCDFGAQIRAGRAYGEGKARIEAVLESTGTTLDRARRQRQVTAAKIAPPVPAVPDSAAGVRDRLAALRELRERHRWPELIEEMAEAERAAAESLEEARAALRAVRRPLDERDELRGRVHSYQAMAQAHGFAEDRCLDELFRQAIEALGTAPCDLPEARAAAGRYVRAIQEELA
jgi:hypothetical protein